MTGFVGGEVTGRDLGTVLSGVRTEPWYERTRLEAAPFGIGALTHGERDPGGVTVVNDGTTLGVVHGAVTNRDALNWDDAELFERVLSDPVATLSRLDGPFAIVAADAAADRFVLATDRLGTRRCYYTESRPFLCGTSVGPLLAHGPDPTLDERGVTDLLSIGQVWGGRTLVEEVQSMPPGAALVYDAAADSTTVERYCHQSFGDAGPAPTAGEVAAEYRRVVGAVSDTLAADQRVGLWLSGGLDSRAMAAELARHHDLVTYTYDANPPTGDNLPLANRVADALGVPNERVALTADGFEPVLVDGVELVDGMVPWVTFLNLSASFGLPNETDVVFEGSGQGGLLGNDVWRADLERGGSPAEALYRSHHYLDRDLSDDLLTLDTDPMRTYTEEVAASRGDGFEETVLQAYRRNFYPYGEFASNAVGRSQAGTRVPFADRDFLRLVARIPPRYRTGAVPFTGGRVPYGTARLKLGLIRELDSGLEQIPYERTGVEPARPQWQHAAGFVLTTLRDRLRSEPTYGGRSLAGEWYRNHQGLRRRVDDLLDDVCDRTWVDDGVVRRLQQEHLDGDAERIKPLACLTTAEQWIQTHI